MPLDQTDRAYGTGVGRTEAHHEVERRPAPTGDTERGAAIAAPHALAHGR